MSRSITLLSILLLYAPKLLQGQQVVFANMQNVRASGMSNTGMTISNPINFTSTPSGIPDIVHSLISIQSKPYTFTSGLYSVAGSVLYKFKPQQGFGFKWQAEGSKELNEHILGLCYGRKLGKSSSMALGLNYFIRNLPESKTENAFVPELSILSALSKTLSAAALVIYPIPVQIKNNTPLPTVIRLGIGYLLNSKFNIQLEAHKTSLIPVSINLGMEYIPVKNIALRSGCNTDGKFSFGFGFQYKENLFLDASMEQYPLIGTVIGFGLNYLILTNKK
jgi:hypothetical protein